MSISIKKILVCLITLLALLSINVCSFGSDVDASTTVSVPAGGNSWIQSAVKLPHAASQYYVRLDSVSFIGLPPGIFPSGAYVYSYATTGLNNTQCGDPSGYNYTGGSGNWYNYWSNGGTYNQYAYLRVYSNSSLGFTAGMTYRAWN